MPVTVKSRIGVDDQDEWESLSRLACTTKAAGAERHIIHARKAWLRGLSPKQNREIPPLRFDIVTRLKKTYPSLIVVANGGIQSRLDIDRYLDDFDGVMLGRVAYRDPYGLSFVDAAYYGGRCTTPTRQDLVLSMIDYAEREVKLGTEIRSIARHMLGIFHGEPGARLWRKNLGEITNKTQSLSTKIKNMLHQM